MDAIKNKRKIILEFSTIICLGTLFSCYQIGSECTYSEVFASKNNDTLKLDMCLPDYLTDYECSNFIGRENSLYYKCYQNIQIKESLEVIVYYHGVDNPTLSLDEALKNRLKQIEKLHKTEPDTTLIKNDSLSGIIIESIGKFGYYGSFYFKKKLWNVEIEYIIENNDKRSKEKFKTLIESMLPY